MKLKDYFRVNLVTSLNVLLYLATMGRYIWLEGRVSGGMFRNWIRQYRYRPRQFVQPQSEAELIAVIQKARKLRVFGAGHSFNAGIVGETLVSLDRYTGVLWADPQKKQLAVRGGTRVRDVIKALKARGLALAAQPSHDAQSIGGILSTDVHGTGRDWGFVSESVVSLKVIDGRGQVHLCYPDEDLFKAAVGGAGAVGVISEVVIQAVERFNIEQKVQLSSLSFVERHLDRLLAENEHLSLYVFPFSDQCHINTWNRTEKPQTAYGNLRELINTSLDTLLSTWAGNLLAFSGLLPATSALAHRVKQGSDLVLESSEGYTRTIYPLHQELEFAVPYEQTFTVLRAFQRLYEHLEPQGLPYGLIELRFTPAGHERSWIGPGRERRSTWMDLIFNDSSGFETYYTLAESLMMSLGGRPHLGKYNQRVNHRYLQSIYGDSFDRFRELVREYDPAGKFVNEFTRRLFEPDNG